MKSERFLRKIRFSVAVLTFGTFLLLFVKSEQVALVLQAPLTSFQVTPALLAWLLSAGGMAAVGFLLVLLLTLLCGRVYCACFCPLGIMQDLLRFGVKKVWKTQDQYHAPSSFLRYSVFFLTVSTAFLGSLSFLNLLDPYSLFGRLNVHLLKPLAVLGNNLLLSVLEQFDVYALTMLPYPPFSALMLAFSLGVFGVFLGLALWGGRTYCNTMCPVGTLLGVLASCSRWNVRLHAESCIACGQCERVCRANCLNIQQSSKSLDATRCVACFDCVAVCPTSALQYSTSSARQAAPPPADRRAFLLKMASALGGLAIITIPLRSAAKRLMQIGEIRPIVPPGALSVAHFSERCTGCHLCVSACPTKVITPRFGEYRTSGILQPALDFQSSYCDYECNLCGQICPTHAITPLPLPEKKLTQIGQVHFNQDFCFVYDRGEECGACAEICPTHAMYTEERDHVLYPEANIELCIGCGGCEHVCPETGWAIWVEGLSEHGRAKEPFYDQAPAADAPQQSDEEEEFPF